jgi:hypothetical protein
MCLAERFKEVGGSVVQNTIKCSVLNGKAFKICEQFNDGF